MLLLPLAAVQAAPTISVRVNPVPVPLGKTEADTSVTWDAEEDAELWFKVGNAKEEKFSGQSKGTQVVAIAVGKKHTFNLYQKNTFFKLFKNKVGAKILASLEVGAAVSAHTSFPQLPDAVKAGWSGGVKGAAPAPPADARYAPTFLYAKRAGMVGWYRHDGANMGTFKWQEPRLAGRDLPAYKQVFGGDGGDIYTISQAGVLQRHRHADFATGLDVDSGGGWSPAQDVATGWGNYKEVFAGGGGVIYAITQNGALLWFRHGAAGLQGPREIADNWGNFKQVFCAGEGIIYALTTDGQLLWYRHTGYANGAKTWLDYKVVATDWGQFEQVFGAGLFTTGNPAIDGATIYAITPDGKLMWCKHQGFRDGSEKWSPRKQVGGGWNGFQQVFALLSSTPSDQSRVYNPNAPKILNFNPFIKNVRVTPGTSDVKISFSSDQKAAPAIVEIGNVAPTRDRNKDWVWPILSDVSSRFVTGQNGRFDLNLSVDGNRLEPNKTYFYLIKVFNDDKNAARKLDQFRGQFTTQNQIVRVVWESVHISNDSDPNGAGEIYFEFWMNYGDASVQSFGNGRNDLPDGRDHPIGKTIIIKRAPDLLTLAVNGDDEDMDTGAEGSFGEHSGSPNPGPGMKDYIEWNVAKAEFDLSRYPGTNVKVPFELRSMPNGGDLGDLQFEAKGYFVITRG